MPEQIIERAGVQLAAEAAGEGVPVVLLHGLTATRRYVVMGSQALQRSDHHVISYDARGHGRSSPAADAGGYTYADLGLDLEAVLDGFEIERAVLAGASMGAHTLLWLALHEHPEGVADALRTVPRSHPFAEVDELAAISVPTVVVASADEADPEHPQAVGEAYAAAIPGARLVTDAPGRSPIAWQGSQLSRVIAELAAEAD